jgi:hypothetical protein
MRMVGKHMHIKNLFLNNFIRTVNFLKMFTWWMRIPDAWILEIYCNLILSYNGRKRLKFLNLGIMTVSLCS